MRKLTACRAAMYTSGQEHRSANDEDGGLEVLLKDEENDAAPEGQRIPEVGPSAGTPHARSVSPVRTQNSL